MIRVVILFSLSCFVAFSCIKAPEYPIEPEIELLGLSTDTMVQSQFNTDSVVIFFTFTDGDGDLGSEDSLNIFVKDLRDNFVSDRFRIPYVPVAGANNGISGEVNFTLYTTCCTYPNGAPPCEPSSEFPTNMLTYEITIQDRAGHISNAIVTPPITLMCD